MRTKRAHLLLEEVLLRHVCLMIRRYHYRVKASNQMTFKEVAYHVIWTLRLVHRAHELRFARLSH